MGTFYLTCLVFVFVVLDLIARLHGFSIWRFIKYLKEELFIVLGTSSSKGAAGITGSGFIVLAATLSAVGGVPVAGLALIPGIDRFMAEARALKNLVGNGVATVVIVNWTGDVDMVRLDRHLAGATDLEADEPEAILDAKQAHMPGTDPVVKASS